MSGRVVRVRWVCQWCRRSFAGRAYADRHEAGCHRNPASRGCSTCAHFAAHPCCEVPSDHCGCKGLNDCAAGAFETWSYNDHETKAPVEGGWWQHTVDFVPRDCSDWAVRHAAEVVR